MRTHLILLAVAILVGCGGAQAPAAGPESTTQPATDDSAVAPEAAPVESTLGSGWDYVGETGPDGICQNLIGCEVVAKSQEECLEGYYAGEGAPASEAVMACLGEAASCGEMKACPDLADWVEMMFE